MRSACLQFAPLVLLCLLVSGLVCAQDYESGFSRMPAPASSFVPPVIENKGQFGDSVRFILPGPSGTVIFARDGITLIFREKAEQTAAMPQDSLSQMPSEVREAALSRRTPVRAYETPQVVRIGFVDSDPSAVAEGSSMLSARANWLIGRDSSRWVRNIPVFEGVEYRNLWPGTSLIFSVNFGRFTCTVEGTGARFEQTGKGSIEPAQVNDLLSKALGSWAVERGLHTMIDRQGIFTAGTVYTPVRGSTNKSDGYGSDCFVLRADYTSGRPSWISIVGGDSDDVANAVCADRYGYVYVTGFTKSGGFPIVGNAYRKEHNGYEDYFSARLKPSGSDLAYSSYLGVGGGALGLEPFAAKWAPAFEGKREKLLAIMVDDGREQAQIKPFLDLGIPMTFAIMPWADPTCIRQIRDRGCVPFLHAPMEAVGSASRRGEVISNTQTEKQVDDLLEGWLALMPGVMGVSNHTGSAATSDPETMRRVAAVVKKHGLMFYDSNTAPVAIGANVFRDLRVPCLQQDFFLDEREVSLVRARMLAMAELAERTGYATCICHVGRSQVPEGIKSVIQELQARGFRFVTVPELYKALTGK